MAIHELIAWGLDDYPFRSSGVEFSQEEFANNLDRAEQVISERACYETSNARVSIDSTEIQQLLAFYAQQATLRQEYKELDWELGVIDLCHVLAFQRRLVFDPELQPLRIPEKDEWDALFALSFGSVRDTRCRMMIHRNDESGSEISLQSSNPDLQLRPHVDADPHLLPFSLYGGSPFFEVAEFRDRWFLRDGYHRAYRLLQAGVHRVPAVVIGARTIDEVGATQPWFFSEKELFSNRPPLVTDFLNDDLVLRYQRSRLVKTIRIRIEESLEPKCEKEFSSRS